MDLNLDSTLFCCDLLKGSDKFSGIGFAGKHASEVRHDSSYAGDMLPKSSEDGCQLILGLGPTPSSYSRSHPDIVKETLASDTDSTLKLGLSEVTKEGLSVLEGSVTGENFFNSNLAGLIPPDGCRIPIPVVDEGSTSAKNSGGYLPSLLLDPRLDKRDYFQWLDLGTTTHCPPSQPSCEMSATTDVSVGTISEQTTTMTSSDHRTDNMKKCKFPCCSKGARGASGLCIGHGGGQRCQKPGCKKGAESRTAYCKSHGGGRRCQELGCTKSAEGKTEYCIAHGGGKRCGHPEGCTKAARGKSGLCIKHGGGKRCRMDGCNRSAEGQAGVCISHGGGRRCQFSGCPKGAQGSTMYCKAHGGGKRCVFAGCTKGAEGSTPLCKGHGGGKRCLFDGGGICPKSVHGGTNFCVAHGGGKRCAIPGCTKSARGRTDCCVKHGGGKRCKFENCGKSAQGSTDFCKAHGGGKRCTWPGDKCKKFARGKSGLCAAHSSIVQEWDARKAGGLIGPGLFHGLVTAAVSSDQRGIPSPRPAKRQQLIPHNVLVPTSMKSQSAHSNFLGTENSGTASRGETSLDLLMIPEGRVHGGGLMSLLGGNLRKTVGGI